MYSKHQFAGSLKFFDTIGIDRTWHYCLCSYAAIMFKNSINTNLQELKMAIISIKHFYILPTLRVSHL